MDIADAVDFARTTSKGVLITLKADGRPQSSNITYAIDADGVVLISITADRAKAKNLARDPRACVHISRDDFWAYAVLEGDAELLPPAADLHDATVEALIEVYRLAAGEHPDWDEYRAAMVADRRLVVRLLPTHAYGMLP